MAAAGDRVARPAVTGRGIALRVFRRVVVAPAFLVMTALIWLFLPFWAIALAFVSPWLPGARWRPLRVAWVVIAYVTVEALMLIDLFGLWLLSGCGLLIRRPWFERIHYNIVQTVMRIFFSEARRVAGLRISTVGPAPDAHPGRPLLVCCRHAGPADSFVLIHTLMDWYGREPRVVLKNTLAWDPAIDVILNRIPARFISPNPAVGEDIESQITALATGLDDNDAFVIFPEGGNFTPRRRQRAIDRLHELGLHAMAERAERWTHVLAPRPGGLLAALDAAPEADVVLVGHTGLDHLVSPLDIWNALPMDTEIVTRWWSVPRAEIPDDREARIDWLYDRWAEIDDWIQTHRTPAG